MQSKLQHLILFQLLLFIPFSNTFAQRYSIVESTNNQLTVEFDFSGSYSIRDTLIDERSFQVIIGDENYYREPGDPWLPLININVGIPHDSKPAIDILNSDKKSYSNKFIMPFPETDPLFEKPDVDEINMEIYSNNQFFPFEAVQLNSSFIFRYAKILTVSISPFQFNPVTRELVFNRKIIVRIKYNASGTGNSVAITDAMTNSYLKSSVINFDQAKNWISKSISNSYSPVKGNNYWYNPNKNYYKFYLKEKGVYRVTYSELISESVPLGSTTTIDKLELFSNGISVPIDIVDANDDSLFNDDDYIQFVGYPPPSSPYSYFNIYNHSNVYWFSYENDSTGNTYTQKDAYPNFWVNSFATVQHTLHYEIDTLYERLGHASNDERDYWYWGTTSGINGSLTKLFTSGFPIPKNLSAEATSLNVSLNMHGMTTNANCIPDHRVKVYLTSQLIGEHTWDGPNATTFSTEVDLSQVGIFNSNNFQVAAEGDICPGDPAASDEVRINWYEIEYPRDLRADENNISFKSPPGTNGLTRFQVFSWQKENMKIYVPEHEQILINPLVANDQFNSVFFVDSLFERTEYFCASDDFFMQVDSIVQDQSSNLRDISNGGDYLIITHSKFSGIANQLANFRTNNFPDENITNPRILITDVQQIYDEFSYGLLDPFALQSFVKYAFENWQQPAPSYVVFIGDMSYDYRELIAGSRPNFIPSIPFHAQPYGQAASDNIIVSVAGDDLVPDIAIGRLSAETHDEANILLDKIRNYPDDDSKKWKQNALLISSGLNLNDETSFGFNDANLFLDDSYLLPNGMTSTKIFRYPHKPRHLPFQGEGVEIRQGFNDGAVVANYYGHGGGFQWDLVFTNDDIFQLVNGGRLPFVSSVTCYTAHFDNQDVFGEIFNKVEGKGSIGFYGSSGLTYWGIGKAMNQVLFKEIFEQKNYIIGRAILFSKNQFNNPVGLIEQQMALLTYLGDPVLKLAIPDKPDFEILSSDISLDPQVILVDSDAKIKVKLKNYGIIFPGDSIVVQTFVTSTDTSYTLDEIKVGSFGEIDSILVNWVPTKKGLYELNVRINTVEIIPEMDYTDNQASINVAVFDLGEPSIVDPINGFVSADSTVNFLFVDNGLYISKDLRYLIQIDTSITFESPLIESSYITPQGGLLQWDSPILPEGIYFWRTRIIIEGDSTVWNDPRTLTIEYNSNEKGYYIKEKSLSSLQLSNVNYSDSLQSLILNTNPLPPRPTDNTLIEFLDFTLPPELSGVTSITTDGTYIYYAHMSFFRNGLTSPIYKLGTGYNGSIKAQDYGPIPGVEVYIWDQLFYYPDNDGGHIYVAYGDPYRLTKINPQNGDTSTIEIPDGMLRVSDGQVQNGAFYITSNGRYVYNIATRNELGEYKYKIRTFDPLNGWAKVTDDLIPAGESYPAYTNFFVANNYLYPYERVDQGYLRRINLDNGAFEEQWHSSLPFQYYYAWTYDWVNDRVYASVFPSDNQPTKIAVFKGTFRDSRGSILSHQVGPSVQWNNLEYIVDDDGSAGTYQTYLKGFNKNTSLWEDLIENPPQQLDLSSIEANEYPFLQMQFTLVDTSFGANEPIKVKSMNISYDAPPEIMITKENILFTPDTILQGFDTQLKTRILNIGNTKAEGIKLDYYFNAGIDSSGDSSVISKNITLLSKSHLDLFDTISTSSILFDNLMKIVVDYPGTEYFTFNNLSENSFFVARDSVWPAFNITFDGVEIIDGDIVSAKPDVMITLNDNSPLPLDTSFFEITLNESVPVYFAQPELSYEYTPYPNSKAEIHWTPELPDGEHILRVNAKDASNNPFDSTSSITLFSVFNEFDLTQVFNYPNPFTTDTHFTFELRGSELPDRVNIKVYTIAGRLIWDYEVPASDMAPGFNKIYWSGRDQDGDEVANGVYLYKIIAKFKDETKSVTQKLARVR